ncbi:unnamed protein product, partial [Symbiodinium natans]
KGKRASQGDTFSRPGLPHVEAAVTAATLGEVQEFREFHEGAADWLGLHQDCQEGLESQLPQTQPEMTRMLECAGVAWGPVAGEDYFETISLLRAVTSATSFTNFVVVEVGSGIGYWAPKESLVPTASAAANLQRNGIYELCNVTFYQSAATAQLLDSLIQSFGAVDLVHVDIQETHPSLTTAPLAFLKEGATPLHWYTRAAHTPGGADLARGTRLLPGLRLRGQKLPADSLWPGRLRRRGPCRKKEGFGLVMAGSAVSWLSTSAADIYTSYLNSQI